MGLSGVAAFCISKCALSAGALGRNCHLLPHCQPRRGYASFADSQPPALITRSTPSLEPPGQSRHIPSRCCTAGRRAGAGASMQTPPAPVPARGHRSAAPAAAESCCPCRLVQHPTARTPGMVLGCSRGLQLGHPCNPPSLHPSLPVGIAARLQQLRSWLPAPASRAHSPITPPRWFWGAAGGWWGLSGQTHGAADPLCRRQARGGSGLAAPPGIPPGIAPLRDARSHAPSELPRSIPGARPPPGRAEPGPPSVAAPAGTSRALNP